MRDANHYTGNEPDYPCTAMPTRECLGICTETNYCFRFPDELIETGPGDCDAACIICCDEARFARVYFIAGEPAVWAPACADHATSLDTAI